MMPCHVVEIVTPKKFVLNGLWYGPHKARRVFIIVHGLGSSVFSRVPREMPQYLVDGKTAVLVFNNRGFGVVNRIGRSVKGKSKPLIAGSAHEVFTDCVDDIRGAVMFARKQGAKEVYLAGHSTGCQKSIYYAYKMGRRAGVKGLILLAPVSDYAAALKDSKKGLLAKAARFARTLVRAGKKHEMLPASLLTKWSIDDAQRFLSLYTPDSVEEIFSYAQPKKNPRTVQGVKIPILTLWAAKDEYVGERSKDIEQWFTKHVSGKQSKFITIASVPHSFKGGEQTVARAIRNWIQAL